MAFRSRARPYLAAGLLGLGPATFGAAPAPSPVVLELFTSQGCSSCPAADELLSRLGRDERARGLVIPLAFHVDYWNELGWADPLSKPDWTLRQAEYCRALEVPSGAYTPQLVVNGHTQLNGADAVRVLREVDAALAQVAPAQVSLAVDPSGASLAVTAGVEIQEDLPGKQLELFVAVFESGLQTSVARGENGGRTLRGDFVVRRLQRALTLVPRRGARQERLLHVALKREWKADNLGLAAFLQDPHTRRIVAAAAWPPAAQR